MSKKGKKPRLVIRFNIKKHLPKGIRLGKNVADALDKIIAGKLKKAVDRAHENKRTTVLSQDL